MDLLAPRRVRSSTGCWADEASGWWGCPAGLEGCLIRLTMRWMQLGDRISSN